MADSLGPPRDISVLAPPRENDEALSSWLVRTADAHLLTVDELEREIGGPLSGLDRGNATLLPRLAAMTCTDVRELAALAPADLAAHPMRAGPKPPHCWAVCPTCLQEDQAQGRAPYVRRAWTHPLSAFCRAHNAPLVPHGNSRIKIASDLTLFGDGAEPIEPRDNLLDIVEFDDPGMVARVFRTLDDSGKAEALERRLRLRWAVRDVIDAMTTRMRDPAAGALVALLEQPIFQLLDRHRCSNTALVRAPGATGAGGAGRSSSQRHAVTAGAKLAFASLFGVSDNICENRHRSSQLIIV
jgi:hypothetical protein